MWCIKCHQAFSWKTGAIDNGPVHNPHYYQWMKEGGGIQHQPGAEICGGLPMLSSWRAMLQKLKFDGIDDSDISDFFSLGTTNWSKTHSQTLPCMS